MTVNKDDAIQLSNMQGVSFYSDDESVNKNNLQDTVDKISELIAVNPELKKVIDNVLKGGDITVLIRPPDKMEWPAHWDMNKRTIETRNYPKVKNIFENFVFELCNANNPYFQVGTEESKLVRVDAHEKKESYARMMELAEYSTMAQVSNIFEHARKNKLWNKSITDMRSKVKGFSEHWKETNKKAKGLSTSHTDYYRNDFARVKPILESLDRKLRLDSISEELKELRGSLDEIEEDQKFITSELKELKQDLSAHRDDLKNLKDELDNIVKMVGNYSEKENKSMLNTPSRSFKRKK